MQNIFLYGSPGSGKSTLGHALAKTLNLPFVDLDDEIERRAGMPIPEIFSAHGESTFREMERTALEGACRDPEERVISLGGGALLDEANRALATSHGQVLLLHAPPEVLLARLQEDERSRPLLNAQSEPSATRLHRLLAMRKTHYDSFPLRLESTAPLEELVWQAQRTLGRFRVTGMGAPYEVRVHPGGLDALGEHLTRLGSRGPVAVVTDENVGALYLHRALRALRNRGFSAQAVVIPPGETHKTLETVSHLWASFLQIGVERGSTVVALGGGVVGDLTGFAAATFLRGVPWVNVPTSLLAMVDAGLGGKTGADLPQGKNLIGAFHAPRLVLVDPETLHTLPNDEMRNGMAEVIKHGVIGDPALFAQARQGTLPDVASSMAVKVRLICQDPFERGPRAALNLGHTIGHAIEQASGFQLKHGEAVAIGMVAEARLSERLGLAAPGLAEEIAACLQAWSLPTEVPSDLPPEKWQKIMFFDKKKQGGVVHFTLPIRIGEVRTGQVVE